MLSYGWVLGTLCLSFLCVCIIRCVSLYRSNYKTSSTPETLPLESPLTHVYFPKKRHNVFNQTKHVFQVSFKVTGSQKFWMNPDEVIRQCKRHGQKIPSIVAESEHKWTGHIDVGDDLLEIV